MGTQAIVRRRFTAAERDAFATAYRKSGLTQRAFAAQAGISVASLSQWLRRAKRREETPGFVELPRISSSVGAVGYKLEFPGGLKLEIPRGFSAAEVEQLCRIGNQP